MFHQIATPTTFTLSELPRGAEAQTRATLKAMSRLVKLGRKAPVVIMKARQLVAGLPQKARLREAKVIHAFVRDRVRYVRDPRGVETITTPEKMLELMTGDCDDKSILCAALLEAIGHPTRFVAVGVEAGRFTHVYPEVRIGQRWIALECTEPWPMGQVARGINSRMIEHN